MGARRRRTFSAIMVSLGMGNSMVWTCRTVALQGVSRKRTIVSVANAAPKASTHCDDWLGNLCIRPDLPDQSGRDTAGAVQCSETIPYLVRRHGGQQAPR